jgi:CBS-domain-containing membrane protein
MITASDIMTREIISVKKDTPIRVLAELFASKHISSFPVVNDSGDLIGIVTETDLIEQDKNLHIPTVISLFDWVIYLESEKKFEKELKKMTGMTVGDIYSERVTSISPETPLSQIADIMSADKIHTIPVVLDKKVVGMIGRIDLIRTMVEKV